MKKEKTIEQVKELAVRKLARRRASSPKAKYDSLETANGVKRKTIRMQKNDNDSRIKAKDRSQGAEISRHLFENTASWRSIMQQFKVSVVGAMGAKLQINTGDEFAKGATSWFNGGWSKWCDQLDDNPLAEQVALALIYTKGEGDVLCIFDDFAENDGRLRWVESTQILGVVDSKWEEWAKANGWVEDGEVLMQKNGIIQNTRGIVRGYTFTNEYGITEIDPDQHEFTAIRRWDARSYPEGSAKLIKSPWRFNQHRGEGVSLTVSPQIQDIYEMLAAELQSAKKAAQVVGWLELDKDADSALNGVIQVLQQAGKTADEIDAIINGDGTNPGLVGMQYDELEGLSGGKFSYLQPGEKPVYHDPPRPNMDVNQFCDWIQISTGAAMGVGRARSTLKAETSYTAFRGEELMSWQTFEWDQKFLERRLMDFLAIKAITWATQNNELQGLTAPDGWENSISWAWPKMREVDEYKTQQAIQLALKNGTADFSKILGADWEEKMDNLGKQLKVAKDNNLPLSIFETVSGTVIEEDTGETDENVV